MESATILMPPSTGLSGIQHKIDVLGEVLPSPRGTIL